MLHTVIIVNDAAHVNGGAGKVALESAKSLSQRGFRVILFSAVGPVDETLYESGIEVFCLKQYDILSDPKRLRAVRQGIWNEIAFKKFRELLSRYDPKDTIIHFHAILKALSSSLFKVTADLHFKIIVTLHDYFLFCPNGGLFNYQTRKICKIKPSSLACLFCNCDARSYYQKIWRYLRQLVSSYMFRSNKDIFLIYISKLNKKVSFKNLEKIVSHWFFLQNPIDLNKREPVLIEHNDAYLFIGRISEEKGIDLFCRVITELNLKGIVLGDGYLRESYQKKYPNIKFVGWVSGEKKDFLIRQGKALLFPSLWYEGAPLTIIEMKSYGMPCIVPDMCAASEEIENGKEGFVFKSGSYSSLRDAVMRYENTNIKSFQNNILKSFHPEKYSMETHCNNLISIYEQIIK